MSRLTAGFHTMDYRFPVQRLAGAIAVWVLVAGVPCLEAKAFVPQGPAGSETASAAALLAQGWSAVAQRQWDNAEQLARRLLAVRKGDLRATSLLITALAERGAVPKALGEYDAWVAATREETRPLLDPIALAVLRELAAGNDEGLKSEALASLAAAGDAETVASLEKRAFANPPDAKALGILGAAGDGKALEALAARLRQNPGQDVSRVLGALNEPGSAPLVEPFLAARSPVTRMEAAKALGRVGGSPETLRPLLNDPDPAVRQTATLSLARLGDPASAAALDPLLQSPAGEVRLEAAESLPDSDPRKVTTLKGLLQDANALVRLRAADRARRH